MYIPVPSRKFKKSYKKLRVSGIILRTTIEHVIQLIATGEELPSKYCVHKLAGILEGYHECHIKPDLLLIYKIDKDQSTLFLKNIGSHQELFG